MFSGCSPRCHSWAAFGEARHMPVRSAGLARRRPVRLAGRGVARRRRVGRRHRHRVRRQDPVTPTPRIGAPTDAHMPTADVGARVGRRPLRAGDAHCKSRREHRGHGRYRQSHCDSHAAQRRLLASDEKRFRRTGAGPACGGGRPGARGVAPRLPGGGPGHGIGPPAARAPVPADAAAITWPGRWFILNARLGLFLRTPETAR